ncbi:MAG TPA: hypothetical protein PKW33_07050 [Anaerolineaceae bacterium]|nr:hypothetical protein [Anaerolineaceae bacterium]HPN51327.1 hypothetical protein [Anaerolineaceae bacterium]
MTEQSQQIFFFVAIFLLAVLILFFIFRQFKNKHEEGVYFFGAYSPILTWLVRLFRPANRFEFEVKKAVESKAADQPAAPQPAPEPAPQVPAPVSEAPKPLPPEEGDEMMLTAAAVEAAPRPQSALGQILSTLNQPLRRLAGHLFESQPLQPPAGQFKWAWLELTVIILLVASYCTLFLDFGKQTILPGIEDEAYMMFDMAFHNSIFKDGAFQLWNPYFFNGLPAVAHPFYHSFNPIMTIPVLIMGPLDGFKMGICLSFIMGALGMWFMSVTLGWRPLTRTWMALMFAFAGQPVARFFQGQYDFVMGFGFLAWSLAGLFGLVRTRRRWYGAVTALALAWLFFCGNTYYAYFMMFTIAIFLPVMLLKFNRAIPYIHLAWRNLAMLICVGALAIGLIAVQLLPSAELYPRIRKGMDLNGSHWPVQVFLDFVSKDTMRPDAFNEHPAREEFYAYVGIVPFLALAFLPLALKRRDRRVILFAVLVIIFTLVWMTTRFMPWAEWYSSVPFLAKFRVPVRILIITEIMLFILAGLSLDTVWDAVWRAISQPAAGSRLARFGLALVGGVVVGMMVFSVYDLYTTNKPYTQPKPTGQAEYIALAWLNQYDRYPNYVRLQPNNGGYGAATANRTRLLEQVYAFDNILAPTYKEGSRKLVAHPNYWIAPIGEPVPQEYRSEMIMELEGLRIYVLPDSLPFAFSVDYATLTSGEPNTEIKSGEVTRQLIHWKNDNAFEVVADGASRQLLVALVTHYPGWSVAVDGRAAQLKEVNGYLGVDMLEGIHNYSFTYQSAPLMIGLPITLLCLAAALWLLVDDTLPFWAWFWQALKCRWQPLHQRLTAWRQKMRRPRPAISVNILGWHVEISRAAPGARQALDVGGLLFGLTLAIYLFTRLWGLEQYPIYFFTDEASNTLVAAQYADRGFTDPSGDPFPTFFLNANNQYRLNVSVYVQVIPYLLFGKSVFVTRAVCVLITLLAAFAIGRILRDFFEMKAWWLGVLVFSTIPAWFLASRTAFGPEIALAFFALFMYFYLAYRYRNPKNLIPALIFGALCAYAYSLGQLVMVVLGVFLLIVDARYHWKNRRTALVGAVVLVVLAVPYVRFILDHAQAIKDSMEAANSYWTNDMLALNEKIIRFIWTYFQCLDPEYWFATVPKDLVERHVMFGYGNMLGFTLPFLVLGLIRSAANLKKPSYRLVLFAFLISPVGTAIAERGILRLLVIVFPAALLMSLGLDWVLAWFNQPRLPFPGFWLRVLNIQQATLAGLKKIRLPYHLMAALTLVFLGGFNIYMTWDALTNGPTWYRDYGLYGMQWGGQQMFERVDAYLEKNPEARFVVSPSWSNGTDTVLDFFTSKRGQIRLGTIAEYIYDKLDSLTENTVFVMIPDEFRQMQESKKFTDIQVLDIINYPDGSPGFYFVKLKYVDNIDALIAEDKEARRRPVSSEFDMNGVHWLVQHSRIDAGEISQMFDNNPETLVRTQEANPMLVAIQFSEPQSMNRIIFRFGANSARLTAYIKPVGQAEWVKFETQADHASDVREVPLDLEQTWQVSEMKLEILSLEEGEIGHVHVWDVIFTNESE